MISSETKRELRERLLAAEPINPKLRAEYQRKVDDMLDPKLSRRARLWLAGVILFDLAAAGVVTALVMTESLPPPMIGALLSGVGFAVAWSIYFMVMLRRGVYRRRIDMPRLSSMALAFSVIMCVLLAIAGLPTDRVLLVAMLSVLPAGLLAIRSIIQQSEMRMQERLLEVQYRLATLAEKFDDGEAGAGVPR